MRFVGRIAIVTLLVVLTVFASPAMAFGKKEKQASFNLPVLLQEREPEGMIASLDDEEAQERVEAQWSQLVMEDSKDALQRNKSGLYPNPSLQAYVNRLGQSLIPKEASDKIVVTFKIVEDPHPYADTLATGTVYLSSGMISLLDNESQLAFLLMHEAGHVVLAHHLNQMIEAEKGVKRAKRLQLIGSLVGALAGGVVGGISKGNPEGGMAVGALAGLAAANIASSFQSHRFMRELQMESDEFATEVLLRNGFDAREAPTLMAKVGDIVHRSGAAVELAFGNAADLPARSEKVSELLAGPYQPVVDRILQGSGFRMSSPRYSQLISELKRDNGILAFERDLFVIARRNLEEAAAVRTDDPLTMYGLGVLYRTVGRTDEEVARASGYLKSAMEFDEIRHRFPEVYLQYAVELLSREDPKRYPEIQEALKTFVVLYQRNSGGDLPREMRFVYDYLDLTGDRSWVSYRVNNVNSEAPYQLTGNAKVDGNPPPPLLAPAPPKQPVKPAAKPAGKN